MKSSRKYLLVVSLAAILMFGVLGFFANTQPNMELVITNDSSQPISAIDLLTEQTGNNIRLRGIDVGAEVTVKFHSDGKETISTFIQFADGKEIRGERVSIEPGSRVLESVTDEKITSMPDLSGNINE